SMSGGTEGLASLGGESDDRERRRYVPETAGDGTLSAFRDPPVVGVALAAFAYLSVFAHVTDVVGGTSFLVMELAVTTAVAVSAAGRIRERVAVALTVAGFVAALTAYFFSVPESQRALFTVGRVGQDLLALFSGLSVLRLVNVGAWALSLSPVPTFAVVYLTGRERYVSAVTVAAATTGFFVLTGDAGPAVALTAAVGATATVGLAGLSAAGLRGVEAQWDTLAVVLAAMIVVTSVVTVIPGSASNPVVPGADSPSIESSLVTNDDRVSVLGSISLSPEVRFVVESDRPAYWRVGTYDRYTGNGWVRSGESSQYDGRLPGPPGDSVQLEQTVTVKTPFNALPAANYPVEIRGQVSRITQVTSNGGLVPSTALSDNETYTVVSERPQYTTRELKGAGIDYPDGLQARYTQLPDSTSDRVRERALTIVDRTNASNPYEAAVAIERYLETRKDYSLNVPNPGGSIAETFLFERNAGYCTYFATTMVVMLRSLNVPARFVTGYTTGQQVGEDEYVVRGLDSHAWVEVYFPSVGWVRFDPTPAGPRDSAERQAVEQARQNGVSGVDAAGSEDGTYTTPPPTDEPNPTVEGTVTSAGPGFAQPQDAPLANGTVTGTLAPLEDFTTTGEGGGSGEGSGGGPSLPSQRDTVLGIAALVGAVAGARRFGITSRVSRAVWLVRGGELDDPVAATERAYRRLEYLGSREYRPRTAGETPGQYVDSLVERGMDPDARDVVAAYERAHYAETIDAATAEETVRTVNRIVRSRLPVIRRFT
ncbi:MAG: DUF3488 and DUF4129 domain-containing transglutaminase family protein, partial [Halobaculum sp.]